MTDKKIQEYIDKQPYYGHCTEEYKEGIEQGARWMWEELKSELNSANCWRTIYERELIDLRNKLNKANKPDSL